MKRIIFATFIAAFLTAVAFGQTTSRSNTIKRPCANSTTPASVSISRAGAITLTPCTGQLTTITRSGNTLTSYLTSTVTYNNVAVLANTPLSVNVESAGIYAFSVRLRSTQAGFALKLDFGGTATIANFDGQFIGGLSDGTGMDFKSSSATSAGTDFFGSDGTDDNLYWYDGTVEITTAGTFLLRGAQNTANASDTTILRGAYLKLTKLN